MTQYSNTRALKDTTCKHFWWNSCITKIIYKKINKKVNINFFKHNGWSYYYAIKELYFSYYNFKKYKLRGIVY